MNRGLLVLEPKSHFKMGVFSGVLYFHYSHVIDLSNN